MAGHTWLDGAWVDSGAPMISLNSQGVWLSSFIFDGARAFEGVAPDLDLHARRATRSAAKMGMRATHTAEEIMEIAWEGVEKFPSGTALYIRPMFWADRGWISPDPDSTRFALTVEEMPLPPETGFSAALASQRRPAPDMAPTDSKAACLYPNSGRALDEVRAKGFDNAVVLDAVGNVAEFATANLFYAKDGEVHTPAVNGSFLNGVTRQRVIQLLRDNGQEVHEDRVTLADLEDADEIFNTGNYGKVQHVNRFHDRDLQPGPVYTKARELYWDFAHRTGGK